MSSSQRGARLISAAGRGDVLEVKKFIENDNALLRTQDDETGLFPGWTALHWAARNGHLEVARVLLDEADRGGNSADIPLVLLSDHEGDTAMHVAVSWGQAEMVQLLHDRGGNLLMKNQAGQGALDLASQEFRAELSLMAGLNANASGTGKTPAGSGSGSRIPSRTNSQRQLEKKPLWAGE